jgi:hypothetical protein
MNYKAFFNKFGNLKGVQFINLRNYESTTSGEIANHTINVGIKVMTAKQKDFEKLQNCNDSDLMKMSEKTGIDVPTFKTALAEMLTSAEKNLSENIKDRTAQSQAQTDAYVQITPAIKMLKETGEFHIFGQAIAKVVHVEGEYKKVNSAPKTLAKKEITKFLDLRAGKFRTFKVASIETLKVDGETLVIN